MCSVLPKSQELAAQHIMSLDNSPLSLFVPPGCMPSIHQLSFRLQRKKWIQIRSDQSSRMASVVYVNVCVPHMTFPTLPVVDWLWCGDVMCLSWYPNNRFLASMPQDQDWTPTNSQVCVWRPTNFAIPVLDPALVLAERTVDEETAQNTKRNKSKQKKVNEKIYP